MYRIYRKYLSKQSILVHVVANGFWLFSWENEKQARSRPHAKFDSPS